MKNCKDIENSLPLYTEGLLSADEKLAVEEHLKSCTACARAIAQLQRSGLMVQELKNVEPPPWFQQTIMARVREEAERKSFTQKWFYPLRIKIPVQIAATIVIAILAVYIYRTGNEQMKAVLPEAQHPVMEFKQVPTPAEISKAKKTVSARIAEKKASEKRDRLSDGISSSGKAPKMEMQENKLAEVKDKSTAMKSYSAAEKEEKKYAEPPAQSSAAQRGYSERLEGARDKSREDSSLSGTAKKSMMFKAAAPAKPQFMAAPATTALQIIIYLYVSDVNSATVEAEKILSKYDAVKITKRMIDGKVILQTELPAKNLKDILSQLRAIGRVEEMNVPSESGKQDIAIVMEIKNQ